MKAIDYLLVDFISPSGHGKINNYFVENLIEEKYTVTVLAKKNYSFMSPSNFIIFHTLFENDSQAWRHYLEQVIFSFISLLINIRTVIAADKIVFLSYDNVVNIHLFILLKYFFKKYVDYDFTANLENKLDDISSGRLDYINVLDDFWKNFYNLIGKKYLNKKSFPYAKKINFNSIRRGEVIGEHEVTFSNGKEIVTLNHESFDRGLYSEGALAAAKWILNKKPGLYSMRDLLNFK